MFKYVAELRARRLDAKLILQRCSAIASFYRHRFEEDIQRIRELNLGVYSDDDEVPEEEVVSKRDVFSRTPSGSSREEYF